MYACVSGWMVWHGDCLITCVILAAYDVAGGWKAPKKPPRRGSCTVLQAAQSVGVCLFGRRPEAERWPVSPKRDESARQAVATGGILTAAPRLVWRRRKNG